jgi:putative methyltransferase
MESRYISPPQTRQRQTHRNLAKARSERGKTKTLEPATLDLDLDDSAPEETPFEGKLTERLDTLSNFQLHILTHAMRFASAHKITYSTCSIHFEENEGVVFQALASSIANKKGWKILKREHQVDGMKTWERRGAWEEGKLNFSVEEEQKEQVLDACIRCDKGTDQGTMGFFVAGFVREPDDEPSEPVSSVVVADEEEWDGFSDGGDGGEIQGQETVLEVNAEGPKKSRKKKKRKTVKV